MQLSFRITAAAAMSAPPPADGTAAGTDGGVAARGRAATCAGDDVRNRAITLIGVPMLLVALALALAVISLRRRLSEEPVSPVAPAAAPVD